MQNNHFQITDHITFNERNRALCPSCQLVKGSNYRKLNLSLLDSGAYHCHRGCTPEEIREALGASKERIIPTEIAKPPRSTTISPQKVKEAHDLLMSRSNSKAKDWLEQRGITEEMIIYFRLGIARAKVGDRHLPSISIPIPANSDRTAYYQKKRVAPWMSEPEQPPEYKPWSQYGIPATVWFTHRPENAYRTFLCEGEWDAMLLGYLCHTANRTDVAVATFTCGAGTLPPAGELDQLPGMVYVFYDRQDKPTQKGLRPGEEGANKVAKALRERGRIALVPMPDDCEVEGWDVSDAINAGYTLEDFETALSEARAIDGLDQVKHDNPLRSRLVSTDELVARAPDYVEWLVPDLLTADELFALGSPPRGGKSLMCMLLARCVATGQNFLDRPVMQGSVIYVNLEDSEAKVRERVEAQEWSEGLPVYWLDKFKLNETPYLIELAEEIDDLRLIVLDTLSRIRSDETSESAAEMSMVLEPLQEFAKARKVCILLVHHTRKLNVEGANLEDLFDSLRGSGAIRGTCRGLLIIAPADNNCYRLAAENGWGKHDLKIRLDGSRAEWQLLGKWNPQINLDQQQLALDFMNKVGSATIDVIAEETAIPKRSLYTVLDRMCKEGLLKKQGQRKSAVYIRPIQPIQQLNSLLNSENVDSDGVRGAYSTKKQFFSKGDHPESDHSCSCNYDHFLENDHLSGKSNFVELGDQNASNADTEDVSAIQQQFNSNSTVELELGDKVEICNGMFTGKPAFVTGFTETGLISVKAKGWYITQDYPASDLRLLQKGGVLDANG
jgi:hypothetical protein